MKKDNKLVFGIITIIVFIYFISKVLMFLGEKVENVFNESSNTLYVLSSYENEEVSNEVVKYARSIGKKVEFTYMGDLDIVGELNNNSNKYDAVWISNSMWLYMLDNPYLATNSKSISISPVVFGIKKEKAKELGLVDNNVTNNDILNLIKENKIKYIMSSVTQTNEGATAYLGFLSSLAGNPEVLTEEMLDDENLKNDLKNIFSGVQRVSGDEDFLEKMFLRSDDYEAVIASESSLININKELEKNKKEPLYLIYPTDGVAINDSTFGFISNNKDKEDTFLSIQSYLLSDKGKEILSQKGVRTWYGGVTKDSDKKTFNPNWGIDTSKYLSVTKFPSKKVITKAINVYIESLRKPTHVVFCLDYSGSMYGDGEKELKDAMNYILSYDKASIDKLQFSNDDKITVITFSSDVEDIWTTDSALDTEKLINNIKEKEPNGTTDLYGAIIEGLKILSKESDNKTKTIIAMTDGMVNERSFKDLEKTYKKLNSDVPIYSIMFGDAYKYQLDEISNLSNAKTFDGKNNLLKAFKEVRGYN